MIKELDRCEHRFRQLLGALPCGYVYGEVIVNGNNEPEDYSVLDVNHAFSEITTITREKVLDSRISGLFSLSSVKDDIAVFAHVALTGDPVEKEFFSPHFGNHFRVLCFSPEEGYFIALLTDLSREKKLESRLDTIRQFANSTADEFYIIDSTGRFIMGNESVARRLGTAQESIPGHHLSEFNTMADDEWWDTLWNSLLQRGSLQFETEHRGKDNVVYPVEISVDLMETGGRKYAAFVSKNVSSKRILSKALRQDRRFAEQAASMAGYFVWMIDSMGVFRPLLGGESGFVSGPAKDVFFPLVHHDDRDQFSRAVKIEAEGTRELRIKTDRGAVYHKFKWSRVEDNCVVGICYPLSGAGLSGLGSESAVMDAVCLMMESVLERVSKLADAIEEDNISIAGRMARSLTTDFSKITGKSDFPEKVRFDAFLSDNEGMLKQLFQTEIPLTIDTSRRVVGLVDPTSLENILVRLLLAVQSTYLVEAVSMQSFCDALGAGIIVTVAGRDGIQAELERLFIPVKDSAPGLASVYAMVRSGGGRVYYETLNDRVEFTLSFPKAGKDDDSAFILIALPNSVDAARSCAALKSAGYTVALESSFTEILRRICEEGTGVLVMSASMPDFSPEEIMSSVSGVSLIQIGGKQINPDTKYLPDGFRTSDLVTCIDEITATVEMPREEDLQGGNPWGAPHLKPLLS